MKKAIGLFIFSLVFGLTLCFGGGGFDEETTKAFNLEVERFANGVNFDNPSEVKIFENALRKSNALKNYITANKALAAAWGLDLTEDYLINQAVNDQREAQMLQRKRQIEQRKLAEAEAWSVKNVTAGAVLLDSATQKVIIETGKQNSYRAVQSLEKYNDKLVQYTGKVDRISQHLISKNWFVSLMVSIEDVWMSSIRVFMAEGREQEMSELNEGDFITVVGEFWGPKFELYNRKVYKGCLYKVSILNISRTSCAALV